MPHFIVCGGPGAPFGRVRGSRGEAGRSGPTAVRSTGTELSLGRGYNVLGSVADYVEFGLTGLDDNLPRWKFSLCAHPICCILLESLQEVEEAVGGLESRGELSGLGQMFKGCFLGCNS